LTIIVQGQVIKTPFLRCIPPDENNIVEEKIEEINNILIQRRTLSSVVSQDTADSLNRQKYKDLSNQIIKLEIQRIYNNEKIISVECKVLYKKVNKIKSVTRKLEFDKSLNLEIMNIDVLNEISDDEIDTLEVKCISNDAAKLAGITATTLSLNNVPTVSLVNSSSTLISIPFATIDNNDIFSVDCNLIRSKYDGKSLFALGSAPQISASMITTNANLYIIDVVTFYYDPKWSRIVYSKKDDDNYFNVKTYGDNPEDPVHFAWVQSICTSPAGNLFVCDRATRKIYKFSYDFANHNLTCIGNESFVAPGHLQAPSDITCYSYKGTTWLLVADAASNSIHIFNPDNGAFAGDIETFSTGTSTNSLNSPTKLITYSDVIAFIGNNNCFYKGTWQGYGNTIIDGKTVYFPNDCLLAGLGVDHNGTFSVCDPAKMAIHRISGSGEYMCSMVFPYLYYPCDMTEALMSEMHKVMATYVSSVWGENTGLRTFLPGIDILDFRTEYTLDGKTHIFYKLSDPAQVTVQLKRGSDGVIVFNSNHVTSSGGTFEDTFDNNSFGAGSYTFILKCTPYWNSLYGTYGLEKILERSVDIGNVVSVTLSAPQCPEAPNSNLSGSYYKINDNIKSNILGVQNTNVKIEAISPAGYYFFQWSDGNTQNSRNYQFNSSTTLSAVFKKPFVSNAQTAFTNTSQRKFVRTDNGYLHLVYESMNHIWYERSTDNGSTWQIMNGGKYLDQGAAESKNPSIATIYDDVAIVWQEQYEGEFYALKLARFDGNTVLRYVRELYNSFWNELYPPLYSTNADPAIAFNAPSAVLVCWKKEMPEDPESSGIWYKFGQAYIDPYGAIRDDSRWYQEDKIQGTTTDSYTPTVERALPWQSFALAWEQRGYQSSIKFAMMNYKVDESGEDNPGYMMYNIAQQTVSDWNYCQLHSRPSLALIPSSTGSDKLELGWVGERVYYENGVQKREKSAFYRRNSYSNVTHSWTWDATTWHWHYGQVRNVNVNTSSTDGVIGWNEESGTCRYVKSSDLFGTRTFSLYGSPLSGSGIQVNNGSDLNSVYGMTLNTSAPPYYFKKSGSVSSLGKTGGEALSSRTAVARLDSAAFYISSSRLNLDKKRLGFTSKRDSIMSYDAKSIGEALSTRTFTPGANSSISYEIEYGALDTLYSQKALSKDKGIDCRLELQDVDNGGTLKILDRFSLDKLSMRGIDGSSRKLSGSLELRKFAGRNLRLKLVIEDGINARWGLMERVLNAEDEKEIEKITSEKVSDYSLSQNYPNPFNPTTVINYQIPRASKVTLKVYDLLGKEVATLVDEVKSEGKYSVEFNASSLPSGIYLYEIRANEFVKSGKMMLLK
jgi:hypothetical protein